MIRRQRLGTTYTKSPADNTRMWIVVNLNKIVFSVIICLCYMLLLFIAIKIVIFLAVNVGEVWSEVDAGDIYAGPYGIFFKIIGIVSIIFYVFKDKPRKR
ncbi:MAG: hypothetical protein JW808_07545 [Victivallales bacterium]|nr:hypothetical protein [Victivallales bacterium]